VFLSNLGWEEILLLAVIGLIVIGPDRLPKMAQDFGRMLRELRKLATGAAADLKAELGPEMADLDLSSLHPRKFVENALFGNDEPAAGAAAAAAPAGGVAAQIALEPNERPPYDADAT
jgi:sec-independent protein translocase protein TatB